MKKNLILLGMMGVGKTTLGRIVAKKLGMRFFDTDKLIEQKNSMQIKDIFLQKGEAFFRKEEEEIVLKCLDKKNSVIALGGGAFINKTIRQKALSKSVCIYLKIKIKKLSMRLNNSKVGKQKRPLLNQSNSFKVLKDIYSKRKSIYKLANHKINCDKLNIKKITKIILDIYDK